MADPPTPSIHLARRGMLKDFNQAMMKDFTLEIMNSCSPEFREHIEGMSPEEFRDYLQYLLKMDASTRRRFVKKKLLPPTPLEVYAQEEPL